MQLSYAARVTVNDVILYFYLYNQVMAIPLPMVFFYPLFSIFNLLFFGSLILAPAPRQTSSLDSGKIRDKNNAKAVENKG